jgi:L-asparaginase
MSTSFDILFARKRGLIAEILVHGSLCWVHGSEVIHEVGGDPLIYGRSIMKPFQMKVFKHELKDLTEQQRAISISSHSGTAEHIKMAQSLLDSADWAKLQTPPSLPLGGGSDKKTPWHHPCSGKHAAIIRGCLQKGWSTDNYLSQDHPYHQAYMNELKQAMATPQQTLVACPDGCGLPTLGHHVGELARSFAYLVQTRDDDWIWSAMTNHPWVIGGDGRMDTDIMLATQGKVLAKEGADGLLGLAINHSDYPQGLGIVFKIAHGRDEQTMKLIATKILASLGFKWQVEESNQEQVAVVSEVVLPQG